MRLRYKKTKEKKINKKIGATVSGLLGQAAYTRKFIQMKTKLCLYIHSFSHWTLRKSENSADEYLNGK